MTNVLSNSTIANDAALAFRSTTPASSSRRARHQAAFMMLGRRDWSKLQTTELEYEIIALAGKALDATLCSLVEVRPNTTPFIVDQLVCIPPEAAYSAPQPGNSPCGDRLLNDALERWKHVVIPDVQTDAQFSRTWLHRQGIRSAIVVPLVLHDQPLGVLVAGQNAPNYYDDEDLAFLQLVGTILTAHVARAKAEEAIRYEREYVEALLDSTSALTITLDSHGVITRANRACLTVAGLRSNQVVGQPFWLTLCVPSEARLAEASFTQLSPEVSAVEFESTLLTTDRERRFIGWRMCYLIDPREQVPVTVATGVDMTRQRHAEQEARQAIVAAETARRLIEELQSIQSGIAPPRDPAVENPQRPQSSDPNDHDPAKRVNRRTSQRKLFPYRQQIAPYDNGIIPPRSKFDQVRCWDISAGGISFLLEEPPKFKTLVVVLGSGAGEVLMAADVVRVNELDQDDVTGYLVGCRFKGKL
jgi:PAS domain S-box-containing protein